MFVRGEAVEVLHTHYHTDNQPERTRIRGHCLRGTKGEIYLGEQLVPLEAEAGSECALQMIGQWPAFIACVDNLARVAESEASILLYGESGVGKTIRAADLCLPLRVAHAPFDHASSSDSLRNMEHAHLQSLLKVHQSHRARVAAALGITERTLYRKLKQYGLGKT